MGAGLREGGDVPAVPGAGVPERPRVGQAAGATGRARLTSLDNGFLAGDDPARLQAICDRLGPADVQRFFDRWAARLPWPLTAADHRAGDLHRLSIGQLEVSRPQVFDRPVQGRHFFEAVIRDNLDLGRPDKVHLRILRPGSAALVDPPDDLPHPLRDALGLLDQAIDQLCDAAQLHPEAAYM